VHGIGDEDVEELRRKKREWAARQPTQRCSVVGCEFQTKKHRIKDHQARVHGIGTPKKRAKAPPSASGAGAAYERLPTLACPAAGCEYETKFRHALGRHAARKHPGVT
jgi:hypothetical protein